MAISFHRLNVPRPAFNRGDLKRALVSMVESYHKSTGAISIIFCSDEELLLMNQEYLKHDYYTDIITFDYSEDKLVSGDLFISIDRIRENARNRKIPLKLEIWRVVGHGVLHLLGFKDQTGEEREQMTQKENQFLKLVPRGE